MSDEAQPACVKCGSPVTVPEPVTRLISVGTAAITGGGGDSGPLCPACDDERCHLYALFCGSDGFGFCGCGCPEDAYALVRAVLELCPLFDHRAEVAALLGDSGIHYFVLYAIDRTGLIEHGSSVGGSWLTAKGKHYLPLMRKYEWDELGDAGHPHSDEGADGDCGPGCPHWEASTEDYRKDQIRGEAKKWQFVPSNAWTALDGAEASVLTKWPAQIQSRPGKAPAQAQ